MCVCVCECVCECECESVFFGYEIEYFVSEYPKYFWLI